MTVSDTEFLIGTKNFDYDPDCEIECGIYKFDLHKNEWELFWKYEIAFVPDTEYGEKVVVAVQCSPGNALSIDALHGYLDGKLARFKWPKILQILDALPREDTGKIFKNKLRAHFCQ